ncbi:MAG: nucleotide exchange factor GrpE [Rubricoccaceae bacterium]|nr:nucleotide exchange factor GrpE [Rubricoccaceae bacterium]
MSKQHSPDATPQQPPATPPGAPQPEAADVALAADGEADEVARLRAEVKALNEQVLRRAAEFQNYRRRTAQDLASAAARGREDAVLAVLDVYDDLRRALEAAEDVARQAGASPGPAYNALHEGVELVYKKFTDTLGRLGVEVLPAVGEPFDEALHDALMQQPAPDPGTPSGTVIAEIQPGYRLGDRVLRHAQVVVAQ